MNERIKELAKQAEEFHYSTWDAYNQKTVNHYRLNTEKFAELIVKECAETCKENLVNDAEAQAFGLTYNNAVDDCAIQIKQHFGIEK